MFRKKKWIIHFYPAIFNLTNIKCPLMYECLFFNGSAVFRGVTNHAIIYLTGSLLMGICVVSSFFKKTF